MTKLNLKPVFSTPVIFFSTIRKRLNFFKKIRLNSFIGGLIFGAVFSLVVNIVTVQIQETIQKQRILEAVEWEIYNNSAEANSVIRSASTIFKEEQLPSMFYTFPTYSRDLWSQSTEPMQYIAQLPPEVQSQVVIYYTHTIKKQNELLNSLKEFGKSELSENNCFFLENETDPVKINFCKLLYYQLVKNNIDSADDVFKSSWEVLDVFHPTQDRLSNWFLKFMMGDKSVRILSGE